MAGDAFPLITLLGPGETKSNVTTWIETKIQVPRNSVTEGVLHAFIGHWLKFRKYFDLTVNNALKTDLKNLGLDVSEVKEKLTEEQRQNIVNRLDSLYENIGALRFKMLDRIKQKEVSFNSLLTKEDSKPKRKPTDVTWFMTEVEEKNDGPQNCWFKRNQKSVEEELRKIHVGKYGERQTFMENYQKHILRRIKTETEFRKKIDAMQNILISFLQSRVNEEKNFALYYPSYGTSYLSYYKLNNATEAKAEAHLVIVYQGKNGNYSLKTCYIRDRETTAD